MERLDLYKSSSKNGTKFWCGLSIGSTECSNMADFFRCQRRFQRTPKTYDFKVKGFLLCKINFCKNV